MNGRDYMRYFNMLLDCYKKMDKGHGYCFDDVNFHKLHEQIGEEIKRIGAVLKIEHRDALKQFVYDDELVLYAVRILKLKTKGCDL